MPARRGKQICDCQICEGRLVDANIYLSHQTPLSPTVERMVPRQSLGLATTVETSRQNLPNELPLEALPTPEVMQSGQKDRKQAKKERMRYTQRAAGSLNTSLAQANEIFKDLEDVKTHDELDRIMQRIDVLKTNFASITHQAPSLDQIRLQIGHQLGLIGSAVIEVERKLGERCTPIPVTFDIHNPQFTGLTELSISLVLVLMLFFGLGRLGCEFCLQALKILIVASVSCVGAANIEQSTYAANQTAKRLPIAMKTVLRQFGDALRDRRTIYATCPSCSSIHPPSSGSDYPNICINKPSLHGLPCNTILLEKTKPIRPFILPDLFFYIAKLLSDRRIESLIDKACEEGMKTANDAAPIWISEVFQAEFLCSLKGPDGACLFIDGGPEREARLVLSCNVDWFNVFRSTHRGPSTSTGVICLSCLNLPPDLRYRSEYMYVAIIPGPKTPGDDQINHFLKPLIDSFCCTWTNGIHLPSTPNYPNGRVVRAIIGPVVCDLPAARKVAGLAAHNTTRNFCSVCNQSGKKNLGRSDHPGLASALKLCGISSLDTPSACPLEPVAAGEEEIVAGDQESIADAEQEEGEDNATSSPRSEPNPWKNRSVCKLRDQAFQWLAAGSSKLREKHWRTNGVRWSELWRLPYWNPVQQLVIDPMHSLLEGVVQYHFREILRLSEEFETKPMQAFEMGINVEDPRIPEAIHLLDPKANIKKVTSHIKNILKHLTAFVGNETPASAKLEKVLNGYCKPSLYYVASHLSLLGVGNQQDYKIWKVKRLVHLLVNWRMHDHPLRPETFTPDNLSTLQQVRSVIKKTDVPSWLPSVPKEWGSATAGTPKADEWRTMAMIYFPIALIISWSGPGESPEDESRRQLLELTMCVVQATWLACRRRTTFSRRAAYLGYLCTYLHNLQRIVPGAKFRPNQHLSLHIYDFLHLWGPVHSWWCFPFERVNGLLQRIPTSNIFGQLEITMANVFGQRANFRHWLSRNPITQEMQTFRTVFSDLLESVRWLDETFPDPDLGDNTEYDQTSRSDQAHYRHEGINYSRERTHVGNSVIAYTKQGRTCYGTIQGIVELKSKEMLLEVKPYNELPEQYEDPFSRYTPHFPVRLLSNTRGKVEDVSMDQVKCHCARYHASSDTTLMIELLKD